MSGAIVRQMKSLPLRQLLRDPKLVKKLTASGQSVRITDNGKPLWVVQPDPGEDAETDEVKAARDAWVEEEFVQVLKERKFKTSAAKLIIESRQW